MYGVESCVHPDYQGLGVGTMLMNERFDTARRLNLRGLVAGSIIMDYHRFAGRISVVQYVREVIQGIRFDNNLSKQMRRGFQPHNLIRDYDEDWRSCNWGVAIVWENPDYRPEQRGQSANMQPRPAREAIATQQQPRTLRST
jgi:hypothetical protein